MVLLARSRIGRLLTLPSSYFCQAMGIRSPNGLDSRSQGSPLPYLTKDQLMIGQMAMECHVSAIDSGSAFVGSLGVESSDQRPYYY